MKRLIVYGTGSVAKDVIKILEKIAVIKIVGIVDSNRNKWNTEFEGYKVSSPEQIKNITYDNILIASSFYHEIESMLVEKHHISRDKIIVDYKVKPSDWLIEQQWKMHYNSYKWERHPQHLKEKAVVYTAIFGNYDDLKEPEIVEENFDYICFTNIRQLKSKNWKIIHVDANDAWDMNRNAKIYKILPHKFLQQYQWSIWVDASLALKGELKKILITQVGKYNISFCIHPFRVNIFQEMKRCIELQLDQEKIMQQQIDEYRREGYQGENGLICGGFIIRKHNEENIIQLMEAWWDEIQNASKRDQLSFPYVAWKKKEPFDVMNFNCFHNEFFQVNKHEKDRNSKEV